MWLLSITSKRVMTFNLGVIFMYIIHNCEPKGNTPEDRKYLYPLRTNANDLSRLYEFCVRRPAQQLWWMLMVKKNTSALMDAGVMMTYFMFALCYSAVPALTGRMEAPIERRFNIGI